MVEHWDNIQLRVGDMVLGATEIDGAENTEENRATIRGFIEAVIRRDTQAKSRQHT